MASWFKIGGYAAAVVATAAVLIMVYRAGENAANDRNQVEAIEQLNSQITERKQTDEDVSKLDAAGLCVGLGGVWNGTICE